MANQIQSDSPLLEDKIMKQFTKISCEEFVDVLATSSPVPGGGGASALVGAIGVALGNMVGSLTVGKKKYAAVENDIKRLKEESDVLQQKLLRLVERDAEVFEPLSKAYGMPSQTAEEKQKKQEVMETVLKEAAVVPLEIMQECMKALKVIEEFSEKGSVIAISDAGVAAVVCKAALQGASLNIFINTKSMQNRDFAENMNSSAEKMIEEGTILADKIFNAVRQRLSK